MPECDLLFGIAFFYYSEGLRIVPISKFLFAFQVSIRYNIEIG